MTDGSGEDSELFLTNTVKKKVQDWDFFISKNIIEAHGWKIWAEINSYDRGATIGFSLQTLTYNTTEGMINEKNNISNN